MNEVPILPNCPRCGSPIPEDAPRGLCPRCVLGRAAMPGEPGAAGEGPGSRRREPPSREALQAVFPQWELGERIGQGGMGFVHRARQPALGRDVAVKVLWPELGADPTFVERFQREARVLARLSHPNIVAVYEFGRAGDYCYLVMELVDGVNLRQAMQAGRFTPEEALGVVSRLCEALQYAHDEGVLHRDIKPENILLDARGRVKIADFGIAKLLGVAHEPVTLTQTGAAVGTPQYMAPEQWTQPEGLDRRADVYSLGVVFYELLTGELPMGRFPLPSEKAGVDDRVDEVVLRTLERDRERRIGTAGEVGTRVEQIRRTPLPPGKGTGAEARRRGEHGRGLDGDEGGGRGTRVSLAGVWLTGLSLLFLIPVAVLYVFLGLWFGPEMGAGEGGRPIWVELAAQPPLLFLVALVALPGVAGTICGWIGARGLRRSGELRRGHRAAAWASVAWPLFVVDVVAVAVLTPWLDRALGWQEAMSGWPAHWRYQVLVGAEFAMLAWCNTWVWERMQRWIRRERGGVGAAPWKAMVRVAFVMVLVALGSPTPWTGTPGLSMAYVASAPGADGEPPVAGEAGVARHRWVISLAPEWGLESVLTLRSNGVAVGRQVMPEVRTARRERVNGTFELDMAGRKDAEDRGDEPDWRWRWDMGRFGGGLDRFVSAEGLRVYWTVVGAGTYRQLAEPGVVDWLVMRGEQPSPRAGEAPVDWDLRLEVRLAREGRARTRRVE